MLVTNYTHNPKRPFSRGVLRRSLSFSPSNMYMVRPGYIDALHRQRKGATVSGALELTWDSFRYPEPSLHRSDMHWPSHPTHPGQRTNDVGEHAQSSRTVKAGGLFDPRQFHFLPACEKSRRSTRVYWRALFLVVVHLFVLFGVLLLRLLVLPAHLLELLLPLLELLLVGARHRGA